MTITTVARQSSPMSTASISEKDAVICIRTLPQYDDGQGQNHLWYAITADDSSNRGGGGDFDPVDPVFKSPPENRGSAIVAVGHTLYVIGGLDMNLGLGSGIGQSKDVYSKDLLHPKREWVKCPSMLRGRAVHHHAASWGGKIYVADGGNSDNHTVWAEVLDTSESHGGTWRWRALRRVFIPYPVTGHAFVNLDCVEDTNPNKLLLYSPTLRLLHSYNIEQDVWDIYSTIDERFANPTTVDGVIYSCLYKDHKEDENGIIYGYDLAKPYSNPKPVKGLDSVEDFRWRSDALVGVGKDKLCVIYCSVEDLDDETLCVNCSKYRVSKRTNESGELDFFADHLSSSRYELKGAQNFFGCLAMYGGKMELAVDGIHER